MEFHPEVRDYIAAYQPFKFTPEVFMDESVAEAYLTRLRAPRAPKGNNSVTVAAVGDDVIDGRVPIRHYHPSPNSIVPVIIYVHGGGWVSGSIETNDSVCRSLANASGCLVVSIEYRLAPEHPYPAPLDDVDTVIRWARSDAEQLGGDSSRVVTVGSSAGANLVAAQALRARDHSTPTTDLQVLIYPVIDSSLSSASCEENAHGHILETEQMRWFWQQYVPDPKQRNDPYASPAAATSLKGLPPAIIITAEADPLRDEAETYAARLAAAGVWTSVKRYQAQVHGFFAFVGLWPGADDALERIVRTIRTELQHH